MPTCYIVDCFHTLCEDHVPLQFTNIQTAALLHLLEVNVKKTNLKNGFHQPCTTVLKTTKKVKNQKKKNIP